MKPGNYDDLPPDDPMRSWDMGDCRHLSKAGPIKWDLEPEPEPLRVAHSFYLFHEACEGECLVWDICDDGYYALECDCGRAPTELADDLGIPRERLLAIEWDISARMIAERRLAEDPTDADAQATIALLGGPT